MIELGLYLLLIFFCVSIGLVLLRWMVDMERDISEIRRHLGLRERVDD